MKTGTTILLLGVLLVGGFLIFKLSGQSPSAAESDSGSNITVEDGMQVVTIKAKDGFTPQTTTVQAGMPTVLRFETNGTFDCTSGIRIPSLSISLSLPSTGTTDVAIGTLSAGDSIHGTCSMGMYKFEVDAPS